MSFIKCVNEPYNKKDDLRRMINYVCNKPNMVDFQIFGANILNTEYALRSMNAVKRRFNNRDGKQLYQIIIGVDPSKYAEFGTKKILARYVMNDVGTYIADMGYQNIAAIHAKERIDNRYLGVQEENVHVHFIINSVSAIDGHKLTNIRKFLNQIKHFANNDSYLYGINIKEIYLQEPRTMFLGCFFVNIGEI